MIVLGLVLLIVALAADAFGIGNTAGIGWKQIVGAIVGILVVAGGFWWGWIKPKVKK